MIALRAAVLAVMFSISPPGTAGEADVIAASVRATAERVYRFDVTIRSRDRGWDYYCERFEIVTPAGAVIATRVLLHPHDDEQPFTRELEDVRIARDIDRVRVRAWMKRGTTPREAGGKEFTLPIPR